MIIVLYDNRNFCFILPWLKFLNLSFVFSNKSLHCCFLYSIFTTQGTTAKEDHSKTKTSPGHPWRSGGTSWSRPCQFGGGGYRWGYWKQCLLVLELVPDACSGDGISSVLAGVSGKIPFFALLLKWMRKILLSAPAEPNLLSYKGYLENESKCSTPSTRDCWCTLGISLIN